MGTPCFWDDPDLPQPAQPGNHPFHQSEKDPRRDAPGTTRQEMQGAAHAATRHPGTAYVNIRTGFLEFEFPAKKVERCFFYLSICVFEVSTIGTFMAYVKIQQNT
ncbi:hypothetical protein [Acanthopleuribacter pedis]|uniref:Uncharacterized protein n=1 Tax=Acanthopleuribacter pedis TaxID=442870 RepID=A0A8J7QNV3_9BACT|nr:hypothetical protein [Acanthopleuribacter pedis]MBO1321415.1 hypothetical protein [Acanthopleuribacter pedis]